MSDFVSKILTILAMVNSIFGKPFLKLTSDGPIILDATITFTAELMDTDLRIMHTPPYYFKFCKIPYNIIIFLNIFFSKYFFLIFIDDDAYPGHYREFISEKSKVATYNVTYSSSKYNHDREYLMNCEVYVDDLIFFKEKIAQNQVIFQVTKHLNGQLEFRQNGTIVHNPITGKTIIRSNGLTEFRVNFHDPSDFLKKATAMKFFWQINEVFYGISSVNSFNNTFSEPKFYKVEVLVLAQFSGEPFIIENMINLNKTWNFSKIHHQISSAESNHSKSGWFHKTIESRAPMTEMKVSGNTWVKSGDMLNLNAKADGSGPWTYCWNPYTPIPYNITGNETCDDMIIENTIEKNCNFNITWGWYSDPGYHNILVVIDNEISKQVRLESINVVGCKKKISYI